MRPLTLDDVLPLDDYAARRAGFFREHVRYVDRCRRVRIGPEITLIFENRRTLWFKVQELLRVTNLDDPAWVERELAWYNRLLPGPKRLQAALLIALPDGPAAKERLQFWRGLGGESVRLRLEDFAIAGQVITQRTGDRAAGTAHWVEFALPIAGADWLADPKCHARVTVDFREYSHESCDLGVEMRDSLLDDLTELLRAA